MTSKAMTNFEKAYYAAANVAHEQLADWGDSSFAEITSMLNMDDTDAKKALIGWRWLQIRGRDDVDRTPQARLS